MAKQLNVNLAFTADTSQARKSLKELQQSLQNIAKMPGRPENVLDDTPIRKASNAALELQQHLSAAVNVNTGNLDLSRFSASLKSSGKQLSDYYDTLSAVGPEGTKTFLQLAQAIAKAEMPTTRVNKQMSEFLVTLKNTAKWQISSGLIHGFMGAIQTSYHYAQDLNESLNNIRIVTGKSVDEMADFAKEANNAAKALNATTVDYTDASLIYYQQGLDGQDVADRADITIKMANVARESAEDVSQQLTAIWNNFYDGSESLESYADKMVALGAATASSSDEIAAGLNQFAAVANTVGLSYDYATAALATVTATTRQSADVVGNAFKTLFARIEGLKLGETLEDGTDLNKYSKALAAVGIDIKNANGDMKEMDQILDELGAKWGTLAKDQQVALAQTVAGVRQYTQMVSLMDNWDYFQDNLKVAKNATGELNEQAEIYAQSWEAARDRVRAAMEGVYDSLINDDFFINLGNVFETLIEGVDGFADAFGGVEGILRTSAGLFLSLYAKQMPQALENLRQNLMVIFGQSTKLQQKMQSDVEGIIQKEIRDNSSLTQTQKIELEAAQRLLLMRQNLLKNSKEMSDAEKLGYQQKIDNVQAMYKEAAALSQETEELRKQLQAQKDLIVAKQQNHVQGVLDDYATNHRKQEKVQASIQDAEAAGLDTTAKENALAKLREEEAELEAELYLIREDFQELTPVIDAFIKSGGKTKVIGEITKQTSSEVRGLLDEYESLTSQITQLDKLENTMTGQFNIWRDGVTDIDNAKSALKNYQQQLQELNASSVKLDAAFERVFKAEDTESFQISLEALAKKLHNVFYSTNSNFNKADVRLDEIIAKLRSLGVSVDDIKPIIHQTDDLAASEDRLNKALKNSEESSKELPEQTVHLSTSFSQLSSSLMMTWSAISSVREGFKVLTDEESTIEQKIGALIGTVTTLGMALPQLAKLPSAITGIGTALKATSLVSTVGFAPLIAGAGLAIGGAVALTKQIDKMIVTDKEAEAAQKKLTESMNEATEAANKATENISKLQDSQGNPSDLAEEFEELSKGVSRYGDNVSLTSEEYERYQEIVTELAGMSDDIVLGYNAEGKAIIDKNNAIQNTIDLMRQERLESLKLTKNEEKDLLKQAEDKGKNAKSNSTKRIDEIDLEIDESAFDDTRFEGHPEEWRPTDMVSGLGTYLRSDLSKEDQARAQELTSELSRVLSKMNPEETAKMTKETFDQKLDELESMLNTGYENNYRDNIDTLKKVYDNKYFENVKIQYENALSQNAADLEQVQRNYSDILYRSFITNNSDVYNKIADAGFENGFKAYLNNQKVSTKEEYQKTLKELQDSSADFTKGLEKLASEDAQFEFNESNFKSYDEYLQHITDFAKKAENADISDEAYEIAFGVNFTDDKSGIELDEEFDKLKQQIIARGNEIGEGLGDQIFKTFSSNLTSDQFQEVFNSIDWNSITSLDDFNKAFDVSQLEALQKAADGANTSIKELMTGIQSGDIDKFNVENNEAFKSLQGSLDDLIKKYPDLTEEANILNQTWLVGTQEYSEALEKVQDKLYDLDIEKATREANEAIDDFLEKYSNGGSIIDIEADTEGFQNAIEKILDAEYAIDVKIHTEAEQEFDSITSAFDTLQEQASKIGENFIVAADDVRELNNAFPGILDGMEIVGDGTVRLNEQIVQSAMQSAEAEAQADANATIDKLNNQAELLRAKQRIYEQMANAALVLAESETGTDQAATDARATLSENLGELKKLTSQETANSETNNDVEVANSSNTNGQIVAQNWKSAFQSMADSSYQAASIAINNMNSVASGGKISAQKGSIDVQYNGSTGQTTEASIVEATEKAIGDSSTANQDTWRDLAEQYGGLADAAGSAANDIEGMIAQIGASGSSLDHGLGGIARGKGSKDSSGGDSKAKDPEQKEFLEEVADRYYDVNNAISKANQQLERNAQIQERLDSMQEHYAGETLIASLKQENKLLSQKNEALDTQYENYKKLFEIQSQELAELQNQLGGTWNGNELQNYSQLFQENINRYNAAIATYNAMSAEQQEESGKQMIKDAEEAYKTYSEALERYQDLYYNEMYETENKLAELRQEQLENQLAIIENNLQAWETEIQLKLDTTEAERQFNDFLKDVQQDFRKLYEDLTINSAFDTKNLDTYVDDVETRMKQVQNVMAEINKMEASKNANGEVALGDDFLFGSISEAQEYLKELQNELVDAGNNLNQMYQQVWDNYIEGLEQAADHFSNINDEFEHITDGLEYEKELIELIYGDEAYDLMNEYYETQSKNINEQIQSIRTQATFWEDQFNKAYQMNKDAHNVDLNDMSTWTEDMQKAYEEMISSQEKLNDLVLEGIENLRDEYINNIAKTLENMDKALWGMNFDDLKEDWDYLQNKADEYLDDVEGAYQIQSLANKIDTSIAETSSLKAQQKLMALREDEINYLREKENLTQDDIDLAEARYQIALKEIALEDAQNNKTSMKLNRDESGNWTYQYVADDSDVLSKQQELLDAYNNLYTTADNAYQHAMELSMNTYEEYKEKLTEIAEDITLSEEEKYIKMQELRDTYMPDITAAMENANLYEQETIYATGAVFSEVCDQDKEAYESLTEVQKELVDAVKEQHLTDYEEIREAIKNNYDEIGIKAEESFKETNLNSQTAAADVIAQWDGESDSVKAGLNDAFNSVVEYTQNFEKELRTLEEVSGKTIADAGGVTSDFNSLGKEIDTVGQKTEDMANKATSSLTVLRGFVNEVENAWNGVISKIQEATNTFQEYIAVTTGATVSIAGDSSNSGDSGSGSVSGGDGSGNEIGSVGNADIEGIAGNIWTYGEWGDNPTRHALMRQKFGDAEGDRVFNAVQAKFEDGYGYNGGLEHDYDYYKNYGPSAFYTGGYTGEWGSEGRIGILHEKELILNANDTQNLLETIRTVQDITGLNNSIGSTIADSLAQMVLKSLGFSSKQYETSGNDSTSNVFNITAEFPNADDVQTIREAILSLPNIASQFIHEK